MNLFGESQKIKQLATSRYDEEGEILKWFLIGVVVRTIIEWIFR